MPSCTSMTLVRIWRLVEVTGGNEREGISDVDRRSALRWKVAKKLRSKLLHLLMPPVLIATSLTAARAPYGLVQSMSSDWTAQVVLSN